jgi:Transposase IS66 family
LRWINAGDRCGTSVALDRIADRGRGGTPRRRVYAIEDRIRGKSADIRCAVRQAETKPLMEDFKLWLDAQKSGLAGAIRYARSHWGGLTRFLSDGGSCLEPYQCSRRPNST